MTKQYNVNQVINNNENSKFPTKFNVIEKRFLTFTIKAYGIPQNAFNKLLIKLVSIHLQKLYKNALFKTLLLLKAIDRKLKLFLVT